MPCTAHAKNRDGTFFRVFTEKTVVTPCGLLQKLLRHYLSLPDVETNTMMCRTTENIVEKLSVKLVFAGWSKVTKVVTIANLLYTTGTKRPSKTEYSGRDSSRK
jgi:hypothetical protein